MAEIKGVFKALKKNGDQYYRASFTNSGKHISLGSFDTAEDAGNAYKEALLLMSSTLTISDYSPSNYLSFEKWVILVNFRDNGIYIKTPIYLKHHFFNYYLNENDIYTFDAEELFYYSTHKIMKRGSHLFVADFGMQINIVSRYGIKNYAVENKDYYFVNNDNHDFRRSNIVIINRFNGVSAIDKGTKKEHYITKIHVNGDFIVGKYNSEIEAAIAYNKAVDCLAKNGLYKNYEKNYIESLSKEEYLKIYDSVSISYKLKNML